ncbi:hypothetical protein [Chryseobacterium sp. G0162]|uniref:hypothetical protein n=1 Tax=Chryseobacterium sp. G0162 TaxID=2487063 RepID=UPI000F511EF5|nr:hypothetical protein [Chryseobacterium sp. G0162]
MTTKSQHILSFMARNFLLFFQIYAIVYVFINSYIDVWFTLNKETFFEFEKVVVINFFQAEALFLYILYHKIRNKNYDELKTMYLNYQKDMESQGFNKRKAAMGMLVAILIFVTLFGVVIFKSPLGGVIEVVIGLNQILLTNMEILIPCLLLAVFLYLQLKSEIKDSSFNNAIVRLGGIIYSFKISIFIFIVLFVIRILFSGRAEDSFAPAGLLAINIAFLITIIKQKSFNAINSKS